ncbi:E3 ubiquitin-protein ligase SIRP1-like [Phoenix dactylifera]|uniref:E3 ubiquitin-protein ligase SIRP1-like n=1 Tax=Phoenix dactylifera TaxID=42345 RepID=A0A8B8ZQ84_PHODC|nr:E3 ubiquitin-protein ligase SIRP1-like [Phoenix dactylifera]XP_038973654.1 E3 ubiquitin-protein ligase SIRP1-like [Phoenix dactylifera]
MAKVEIHHLGDTVIQLQAHGVVHARPQVVVHLRVTEFDDLSASPAVMSLRFYLGQLSLLRAVPGIVSLVASNLDAKIRQLCERRLLLLAFQPAVELASGSSLELVIDIGTFLAPGCSAQDSELIDEWMFFRPLQEEELIFVQEYYYAEEESGFGGVPASKSFIQSLRRSPYGRGEGVQEEECVICLEDFDAGAEVSMTPCSHSFHSRCITQWLEKSHLCPICRYHMPTSSSYPQGQPMM